MSPGCTLLWFLGWPFLSLALWRHDAARLGRPRGAIEIAGHGSVLAAMPVAGNAVSQARAKDAVARLQAALPAAREPAAGQQAVVAVASS